ncbi:hypothetical protein BH10BAC2_BH10BAC2_46470 [soil metagenome]
MKMLLFISILMMCFNLCRAQTWAEWFQQKETQKKYLIEQIAALQVYLGYAKKGYDIASEGIRTISDIKNGEFNLHGTFFNSLKAVNPKIKSVAEVAAIIALQISIVQHFKSSIKTYHDSQQFNNDELGYIGKVYADLTTACLQDIDQLIAVITDNTFQMTDDERLKQINIIYADMQDKNQFTQSFTNSAKLLAQQRTKERNDINVSQNLYGLPKP